MNEEQQAKKLDEISNQLVDVRVTLASLAAEVKAANAAAAVRDTQHADHELRLRALEKFRWLLVGGGALGGGAIGSVVAALIKG